MKLYIAISKKPFQSTSDDTYNGSRGTSMAYTSRESLAAWGYDDSRYTIVVVEMPAPESDAHRVWRQKWEAAVKRAQSTTSASSFLCGFDFAYPEPPFAEGGSQADAAADAGAK